MIPTYRLEINRPDDSGGTYTTTISSEAFYHTNDERLFGEKPVHRRVSRGGSRSVNPIHDGIKDFIKGIFQKSRRTYYGRKNIPANYTGVLQIKELSVFIQKNSGRHHVNGIYLSLENMSDVLARVIYRSCFTDSATELNKVLWNNLQIPENVSYVLENRLPFFFYEDYEKHDVRINVQRTGTSTCAVEVSDGVWGEISFKELDRYCNFYVHGKKRGSWPFTSPKNLFTKLVKREPTSAELKLMIAFLQQNRKQDLVERRAFQLITDMVEKQPERLFPVWNDDKTLNTLFVRGKGYDWKLDCQNYKASGTQNVSTYVWQEGAEKSKWHGPICIDNMTVHSSVGDQFAARAMALLNDNFTIKIVSTINSYITEEPNENRADINEQMRRMR